MSTRHVQTSFSIHWLPLSLGFGACLGLLSGCQSLKHVASSSIADTLAQGGTVFAADDDPELVRQAVPFSLKLMESVLADNPRHAGLLEATAASFTQYAYAFVLEDADELEARDFAAAEQLRLRARKLLLRAHGYALRGLESAHPGFSERLNLDPKAAVAEVGRSETGLLYWGAASLGAAISVGKDEPSLIARLPQMEALVDRALALDPAWGKGAIHGLLISYEGQRQGALGTPRERAWRHYEEALALAGGALASPHVSYAEAVCVEGQDLKGFETALKAALDVDASRYPEWRLANEVMQRRARWLLSRKADLFLNSGS